jgi:hypothetical protein
MKKLLLVAIVLGSASVVPGQTPSTTAGDCKLTVAQAPALRGIRLGMTIDQTLAVFPGAQADSDVRARLARDYFGSQSAYVDPAKYESKEEFGGVNFINLSFLDGRLTSFSISYKGPEWRSDEQFAARVAESLSLPGVGSWKPIFSGLALACEGFRIGVSKAGTNSISMNDLRVDVGKIVNDRAEVPKEQARRAFKP